MAKHSAVYDDAVGERLFVKEMRKSGIKKE
jgi:hypothetical protein